MVFFAGFVFSFNYFGFLFLQFGWSFSFLSLSQSYLKITVEQSTCITVIMKWAQHHWNERKHCIHRLLKKVTLGLVPTDKLQKLLEEDLKDVPECCLLLSEVMELQKKTSDDYTLTVPPLHISHPQWFAPNASRTVSL